MVFQAPEYYPLDERLDYLAERADVSMQAVALVNPGWDGGAYIQNATLPTEALDFSQNLTPLAQAARDALFTIDQPGQFVRQVGFNAAGQMRSDLSGLATLADAAFWSARVRLLMPTGAVFGQPDLGSSFLTQALTGNSGDVDYLTRYAAQLLAVDSVWYSVLQINEDLETPLLLKLVAEIELAVGI